MHKGLYNTHDKGQHTHSTCFKIIRGWGCSLVVEHQPSMCEAMASIPTTMQTHRGDNWEYKAIKIFNPQLLKHANVCTKTSLVAGAIYNQGALWLKKPGRSQPVVNAGCTRESPGKLKERL